MLSIRLAVAERKVHPCTVAVRTRRSFTLLHIKHSTNMVLFVHELCVESPSQWTGNETRQTVFVILKKTFVVIKTLTCKHKRNNTHVDSLFEIEIYSRLAIFGNSH